MENSSVLQQTFFTLPFKFLRFRKVYFVEKNEDREEVLPALQKANFKILHNSAILKLLPSLLAGRALFELKSAFKFQKIAL